MNGRISLSFNNYLASSLARIASYNSIDKEIQSDDEKFHTLAVLVGQTLDDPAYGEGDDYYEVVQDTLNLLFCYCRIATRSSTAWNLGLDVRIQTLHRQEEGTMALIVFHDNRYKGDQAIIATMEVDLTHGRQLIYIMLDLMLTIGDFYRNIQISIQTRGYDQWQHSEANLLITRDMVRQLSNTPNVGFAYEIQGVVEYLTSHDVRALLGRRYSTSSLQGLNWVIKPTQVFIPIYNSKDEEIQCDEETFHTLVVLVGQTLDDPTSREGDNYYEPVQDTETQLFILVHKISPYAVIPQQKSVNTASFDLVANEPCIIKAKGRGKISTGISLEILTPNVYEISQSLSTTIRGDGGFGSTSPASRTIFSKLLPKEKHILCAFTEEETLIWHLQEDLGLDYAGDTSPGASVLRSIDPALKIPKKSMTILASFNIWL
ncbi:hypothetical protein ZIOFF_043675 [Zingiber officinale]|uniref:Uncharacterized protein n=1 Tax=Zingiber officinale TaxID=94328 RepID=A0A8J5FX15_ZINOF|nr:hypothetical protein ZIOFF_043675 [Zingiber officinale]